MLCNESLEDTALIMSAKQLKKHIRLRINRLRKQLSVSQQSRFSQQAFHQLKHAFIFKQSHRIAFYLSNLGELDPSWLMSYAQKQGKSLYLPALHPTQTNRLVFIKATPNTKLVKNRYGILEPCVHLHAWCPAWKLDLVITPLVAFDLQGHRLGMGGGFYDRSFAFKKGRHHKPTLIGLAYEFQQCSKLPSQDRDISLDWVVTPKRLIRF